MKQKRLTCLLTTFLLAVSFGCGFLGDLAILSAGDVLEVNRLPEVQDEDANDKENDGTLSLPSLSDQYEDEEDLLESRVSPTPTFTPTPSPTPTSTATPTLEAIGPGKYPKGVNPLTGLPVANMDNLALPPAMVSITNWPPTARPQAGLSFSNIVYELYIGEGMSRFLAIFYGDYPETATGGQSVNAKQALAGPIRSGRLPYESLRLLYNGFIVMASAYKGVSQSLGQHSNIFGSDNDDINSAMIPVDKLVEIAHSNQERLGDSSLSGMYFNPEAPQGGPTS